MWYIEKEFNVGLITEEFLLMKFFNLLDEENMERYNKIMEKRMPNKAKTLG